MSRRAPALPGFYPPGPLYSPPAQEHSITSRLAAIAAKPKAGTQRQRVLAMLQCLPAGATDEEMQIALKMNPSTQRPRRIELVAAGLAQDSGITRTTRSGRRAVVWVST